MNAMMCCFFFSSRRRHTRYWRDWSSDVCSSDLGKAVARLEARLGVRLFHRSTRSVRLTPEGELFLARCARILNEVEEAESELAVSRGKPIGRLRVSIPLLGTLLMPVLSAFVREY